jgi:hypothetical protein
MKKEHGNVGKGSIARRRSVDDNPEFRDLLDHVGRLLAREYVALLTKSESDRNRNVRKETSQ